jgi:hypothetical protein
MRQHAASVQVMATVLCRRQVDPVQLPRWRCEESELQVTILPAGGKHCFPKEAEWEVDPAEPLSNYGILQNTRTSIGNG